MSLTVSLVTYDLQHSPQLQPSRLYHLFALSKLSSISQPIRRNLTYLFQWRLQRKRRRWRVSRPSFNSLSVQSLMLTSPVAQIKSADMVRICLCHLAVIYANSLRKTEEMQQQAIEVGRCQIHQFVYRALPRTLR